MNPIIRLRSLLALAMAVALGIAGYTGARAVQPLAVDAAPTATSAAIPMLETIYVRAEAPIPTLPTIVVSAKVPKVSDEEQLPELASVSDVRQSSGTAAALPHARLDMPYYSFGKLMPRAIKE